MKLRFQVNTRLDGSGARLVDPETGETLSTCTFAMTIEQDPESEPRRFDRIKVELQIDSGERFLPQLLDSWPGSVTVPSAADILRLIAERDEARAAARLFNQTFPRVTQALHEQEWSFLKKEE